MKHYLAYWCNEGLESITDVTKYSNWKQQQLVDIIAGRAERNNPINQMINIMIIRAKANYHRRYEIYIFNSELEKEDIEAAFEEMPQQLADTIRVIGQKIFSDRVEVSNIKIQ